MIKVLVLLGVLYSITNTAIAGTWIGPYSISTIEASGSEVYFYKPSESVPYPDPYSCGNTSWVVFNAAPSLVDRALSIGLVAQSSAQKVMFYLDGCSGQYISGKVIQINKSW